MIPSLLVITCTRDDTKTCLGLRSLDRTIEFALQALSAEAPRYARWLVVLSDMFGGDQAKGDKARELLKNSNVNFIFINSAEAGGFWRDKAEKRAEMQKNVDAYVGTAGCTAQELQAGSAVEMTQSFVKVSHMMVAGFQEQL